MGIIPFEKVDFYQPKSYKGMLPSSQENEFPGKLQGFLFRWHSTFRRWWKAGTGGIVLRMLLCLIGLDWWVHNNPLYPALNPGSIVKSAWVVCRLLCFMAIFPAPACCAQMQGVRTDVCIHLLFSGQQQQYACSLGGTIKNYTQSHLVTLKEICFFPLPTHFRSRELSWPTGDYLSPSKHFPWFMIVFAFAVWSVGFSAVLYFVFSSRNRTLLLFRACCWFWECFFFPTVWLLELIL